MARPSQGFSESIGIWKCWFLRRGENRSARRKTSRSKDENQQQTQPTFDAESGNRTWATLVGGLHGRQMLLLLDLGSSHRYFLDLGVMREYHRRSPSPHTISRETPAHSTTEGCQSALGTRQHERLYQQDWISFQRSATRQAMSAHLFPEHNYQQIHEIVLRCY